MIDPYTGVDDPYLIGYDNFDRPIHNYPKEQTITSSAWATSNEGIIEILKDADLASQYINYLDRFLDDDEEMGVKVYLDNQRVIRAPHCYKMWKDENI